MALIQGKGNGGNNNSVNYGVRKLPNGERAFVTEVAAGTPGAVEMTRTKDSTSGKFKSGDKFYVQAGDTLVGKLGGMWIRNGFGEGPSREISILLTSVDAENNKVAEFLQLPLLDDKGRLDSSTAKLLPRLKNASLDEDISISIFTFEHKAGDKMNDNGGVWTKDGFSVTMAAYQESLKNEDNPKGSIKVDAAEYYTQPKFYVEGGKLVQIKQGEAAPAGAMVTYDSADAIAYAETIAAVLTPASAPAEEEQQAAAPAVA